MYPQNMGIGEVEVESGEVWEDEDALGAIETRRSDAPGLAHLDIWRQLSRRIKERDVTVAGRV